MSSVTPDAIRADGVRLWSRRRDVSLLIASYAFLMSVVLSVACSGSAFADLLDKPNSNTWVTDNSVSAIVTTGETTYIGGAFTYVGPPTGGWVPLDGITGKPTGTYPKVNGIVYAASPDGSGGWYVGGNFDRVGEFARSNIAHILADGTVDDNWDPGANDEIYTLAVSGSTVYAGGYFTVIGGQPRNYIAALDANTGVATDWNPGAGWKVFALVVRGSTVYVGGYFTIIGGQPRNYIAALDANTGVATDWNPDSDDVVRTLALSGSTLYAGGYFFGIGGRTQKGIAALDVESGTVKDWNPYVNSSVHTIFANGSTIYLGGEFYEVGGQPRKCIAAVDAETGAVSDWNPNVSNYDIFAVVRAIAVGGSTVYAGGDFSEIGGKSRNYIAALDADTGLATDWNPNTWDSVCVLSVSGSMIYAGGIFPSIGGQSRNNIAALDARTGEVTDWNPGAWALNPENEVGSVVSALAVNGSTVYAGGWFDNIGGQPRNNIAALDADTGLATDWNPNADNYLMSLVVSGSTVYATGWFHNIGGQERMHIAALDAETGAATDWNPDANTVVTALAVKGSTVYAVGSFENIGGQPRNNIAALDADTGAATDWNPDADQEIYDVVVDGETVYVTGRFQYIGGKGRLLMAALDAATGVAKDWNPSPDRVPYVLAVSGSTVYVGGDFTTIGGQARKCIAALDAETGAATEWNPVIDNAVFNLAVGETKVYMGGVFSRVGGEVRCGFAEFDGLSPSRYSISGTATDAAGSALSQVTVSLTGSTIGETQTNSEGIYKFSGLGGGAYTITPSKNGYVFSPTNRTTEITDGNVEKQDFSGANEGYSISGTVTYKGSVLAGVKINLSGAAGRNTTTDSKGKYSFTGLSDGEYTVTPKKTGYNFSPTKRSVIIQGADVTEQIFEASLITHSISGTVTYKGSVLAGVKINLSGAAGRNTTTDSKGKYSFTGLSDGKYTVTPKKTGYNFSPTKRSVTIQGANVTGQVFKASLITHSISGTVTYKGSVLAGVKINLSGAAGRNTTTDSKGKYSFTGLSDGKYTVTPKKTGYNFSPTKRSVTIQGANVTGQIFKATQRSTSKADATWHVFDIATVP